MSVSNACPTTTTGSSTRPEFMRGMTTSLPVLLGIIPYALVLGALGAQKGLTLVEVPLMTGLNFAGGSEFAALQLWTSPPHILLIVAITFLVNSRHLIMGATLAPFLRHLSNQQAFAALFVMCDESWAIGIADVKKRGGQGHNPAFSLAFYAGASVSLYIMWVVFTTLGAALGPILGDVESYGFSIAFPAVLLVLLRGMWRGLAPARPWFISLVIAAATYLLLPGAWYVATGAFSGLIAAYILAKDA